MPRKKEAPYVDYTPLTKKLLEKTLEPRPETDKQLLERIREYYDFCAEHQYNPTFQVLVNYCGFTMEEVTAICNGKTPPFGSRTKEILTSVAQADRAIRFMRLGDGTHISAQAAIYETQQPIPSGGWEERPRLRESKADALGEGVVVMSIEQLRKQYGISAPKQPKVIDVTPNDGKEG